MSNTPNLPPDYIEFNSQDPNERFIALMANLDHSRALFNHMAQQYYAQPLPANTKKLNKIIELLLKSLYDTFEFIVNNPNYPDEEKAILILSLIKEDDEKRCLYFNLITNSNNFKSVDLTGPNETNEINEIIKHLEAVRLQEDEEEKALDSSMIVEELMSQCASYFKSDFTKFIVMSQDTKIAKLLKFGKIAGQQIGKIGRIAAGVAIGTYVANRITDK